MTDLFSLPPDARLPDPWRFFDGRAVSCADWPLRARELRAAYQSAMYGTWRDGTDEQVGYQLAGDTLRLTVRRLSSGAEAGFDATVFRAAPEAAARYPLGSPVIVSLHGFVQEQQANAAGYTVIALKPYESLIASDDPLRNGAFYTLYPYGEEPESQTGVLMAWAWACGKVLDALVAGAARDLGVDAAAAIVTGVSRFGKAALVAGAFEPRWKLCVPACSGAGGAALYRYVSEGKTYDFSSLDVEEPYTYTKNEPLDCLQSDSERGWFNDAFLRFKTPEALPLDQHLLGALALGAGRRLMIVGACTGEDWVNAPAMWLTYRAVRAIAERMGLGENLAVHMHKVGHAVLPEDMALLTDYFDAHYYGLAPKQKLSALHSSVFDLEANRDPLFDDFGAHWTL